jgi:transposase
MEWLRIKLTVEEQKVVQEDRHAHPSACVRRRLLVLWSLHCGVTREAAARIANVARSTVERDVSLYRSGGLEALRTSGRAYRPTSELAQHTEVIRESFEQQPVRSMAEACHRIQELTGLERGQTQVRTFLKGIGLQWQRVRAIPVPPKKVSKNTTPSNPSSLTTS